MEELKVKVGDKVLYNHWHFGTTEAITTVTKITPTGRIRIDFCDTQFDKYGRLAEEILTAVQVFQY